MKNLTLIVLFFVIILIGAFLSRTITLSSQGEAFYTYNPPHIGDLAYAKGHSTPPALKPLKTEEPENLENETDPYYLLNHFSKEYGVDFELGMKLMWWESQYCENMDNPKSSAAGCFQFLTKDFPNKKSTWTTFCEGDVYNKHDNIKCAMKLIGDGKISHWRADPIIENKLLEAGFIDS